MNQFVWSPVEIKLTISYIYLYIYVTFKISNYIIMISYSNWKLKVYLRLK